MIIAIDGPAASGKGTIARRIARHFGLRHLDTGLLYRAVARDVLARGKSLDDEAAAAAAAHALDPGSLDDATLRDREAGERASLVAQFPAVRAALLGLQRRLAAEPPGAVLDGRDIGTVVCPEAEVKIFVYADSAIRARRRYEELVATDPDIRFSEVHEQIRLRDRRDRERAAAPLEPAKDAYLLDTSDLAIDTAFRTAVDLIIEKTGRSKLVVP